jgi:tRNA (guanine-N7-)-methyltransferase
MSKDKLKRFAELNTFPNVIQPSPGQVLNSDHSLKNHWRKDYFKNSNPITLELGCGKGEYTVELAMRYPEKNFIGIDIKGARMWVGARNALACHLTNVAFIRTRIELINSFFDFEEVDEIWITFPDPQEKKSKRRKRLISPVFLSYYLTFLKKEGIIHLKTDNTILFDYTLKVITKNNLKILASTPNLYQSGLIDLTHSIKTFYEKMFLEQGKAIHYVQFALNGTEKFEDPEDD